MSKELVVIDEDRLIEIITIALKTATGGNSTDVPYYSHAVQKDKYLTRKQAADELLITPTTLSKWVREGIIKNWGKGRKMLFKTSEIEKLK